MSDFWAISQGFIKDFANFGAQFLQIGSLAFPQNNFSLLLDGICIDPVRTTSESPSRFYSRPMRDLIPLKIVILAQTRTWRINVNTPSRTEIVSDLQQILLFWQLQRNREGSARPLFIFLLDWLLGGRDL